MRPVDLKGLTLTEIEELVASFGEPRYRADQIASWVFDRGVVTMADMTNLPLTLRQRLESGATLAHAEVERREVSAVDGTEKYLLKYGDGTRIEAVVLRDDDRTTGCVSAQAGCRFACSFCATGLMGFVRNLTAGEIVEQMLALKRNVAPERLGNVVFMGMGEPLDNYNEVLKAIRIANAQSGLGIGARRMTVSTVGITPGIRRLSKEGLQINLAVSLSAPVQSLRQTLMPIAERYPLDELMDSLAEYTRQVGRYVTLEYVLLRDINDTPEMAAELADLARKLPCKINLICYNEIEKGAFAPPTDKTVESFLATLRARCPTVVRRVSRGSDISAGCGQLAVRVARNRRSSRPRS